MLNLILKDMLAVKRTLPLAFLYGLFLVVGFQRLQDAAYVSAIVAAAYILMMRAASHDGTNQCEIMLLSLPICRRDIVLAKYLSVPMYGLVGTGVYSLLGLVAKVSGLTVVIAPIGPAGILACLAILLIMSSIYYPVFFKWGYIKSSAFNTAIFLVFFFGPIFILGSIRKNRSWPLIQAMIKSIAGLPPLTVGSLLLLAALGLAAASYMLSVALFKQREF